MIPQWKVVFEENGSEYTGWLCITAESVSLDMDNKNAIYADGIHIEIDERIIELHKPDGSIDSN